MVVLTADYLSECSQLVADRVSGMDYAYLAHKHGVSVRMARYACYMAVRKGLVTPQQLNLRSNNVRVRSDSEYIAYYLSKSTVAPNGCVLWNGWCVAKGYGQAGYRGKPWMLHRLIYTLKVGPIPPGMLVCHTCDIRNCWNHEHLFLGTEADNNRDCGNKGRHHNSVKTHCKRGHEYTPENTAYKNGPGTVMRVCKECLRARLNSDHYRKQASERAKRKRQAKRLGEQHVG